MSKQLKTTETLPDPANMTGEERLAYINKLEQALGKAGEQLTRASKPIDADWTGDEKRYMVIQAGPDGNPIRLNGRRFIGKVLVTRDEYNTVMEIYFKAMKSELQRMQQRGNLIAPHLLAPDDVTSRYIPTTIANL